MVQELRRKADTYVAATSYQPWGAVFQRTLGSGGKRVQVTTDQWVDTHRTKTIAAATESKTATRHVHRTTHPAVQLDPRRHRQFDRHPARRGHHRLPVLRLR